MSKLTLDLAIDPGKNVGVRNNIEIVHFFVGDPDSFYENGLLESISDYKIRWGS